MGTNKIYRGFVVVQTRPHEWLVMTEAPHDVLHITGSEDAACSWVDLEIRRQRLEMDNQV